MASLKRTARLRVPKAEPKQDTDTDGVIDLSVTIGYLAADVSKEEMTKLERMLHDHCVSGVVARESGDLEQHLHFQMVCRTRIKSARAFGSMCRKYMDWSGRKNMLPTGKVMSKVLTNRFIHTYKGMIGYCLKDSGCSHFEVAMHNVSDEEVVAGKTLHSIYCKADLKSRVTLTNKNIGERAYVWFKFRENRQLTTTLLSTLTDMINSAMFIPSSSWIIPIAGLGMEHRRMNSFWKCLTDLANVDRAHVADVFIRKREYVKGRYWDEDAPPAVPKAGDEYCYEETPTPPVVKSEEPAIGVMPKSVVFFTSMKGVRSVPCALDVPPFRSSTTVKQEVIGRNVIFGTKKKLFEEVIFEAPKQRSVLFGDELGDFVPLKDIAPLPHNVYLPTSTVLSEDPINKPPMSDSTFWQSISNEGVVSVLTGERLTAEAKGKSKMIESVAGCSSVTEDQSMENGTANVPVIILLLSDSETKTEPPAKRVRPAHTFEDRTGGEESPPIYTRVGNDVHFVVKTEPSGTRWTCDDPCTGKCA